MTSLGTADDSLNGLLIQPDGRLVVAGVASNGGVSDWVVARLSDAPPTENVSIDVKPEESTNPINPKSQGEIPVAILSSASFDASQVSASTVRFGFAGTEAATTTSSLEDVNHDGRLDMVLHFKTQETGIVCGTSSASLTGQTTGGQSISSSESITTVGCK